MSTSANGSGQPCTECGAPADRECIHSLINGMNGNFTKTDSPLTTPTEPSAATSAASWQRPTSTPPRTLTHLLPPTPHLAHLNSFSLSSREGPPEQTPPQDLIATSRASQAVTTDLASTHQDHSSQVTASDKTTSRFSYSPAVGEFGGSQLGVGYHPAEDSKPYISPAVPQHLHGSFFLTNTSQPRRYYPSYPVHSQHNYQYVHGAAMASPYQESGQPADPKYQISNATATSFGSLRFGGLPSNEDLWKATEEAVSIYATMKATTKGAADPVRQEVTREIQAPDDVPKSKALSRLKGIQTYFPDALTAEAYRGACRPTRVEQDDPTIPKSAEGKRAHVRTLVVAFNSVDHANDNQTMKQPFIEKRHDQRLVECLCWEILKAIIARAEFDEPLMQSYDASKARPSHGITSFAQRFDAVVESMICCKTICKHMYDAPYLNIVVDDPIKAKARVDSNRALNAVKAKQMADGKKAQELKAEEDGTPAPAPKRKRTTRVATPTRAIQSPFRRLPNNTDTPPRSIPYGAHLADHDAMDQSSSDAPNYPSSPHDIDVSPARIFNTLGKVEYPEQTYGQNQRFMGSQFGMGMGMGMGMSISMGRDTQGNMVPAFGRHPSGMAMGPAPPGVPVPMQPEGSWNNPQFSAMGTYNVDFSPHGSRQPAAYNQEGSQYPNNDSSEFDTPGSGYESGAENESSPM